MSFVSQKCMLQKCRVKYLFSCAGFARPQLDISGDKLIAT